MSKTLSAMAAMLLAAPLAQAAEPLMYEGFENENTMRFFFCDGNPVLYNAGEAEKAGCMKVYRADINSQDEARYHGGARAFALDVMVDKNSGNYGAHNRWRSKAELNIPLVHGKPVFMTGFVYAPDLPPDITIQLGVLFNGSKNGQPIKGGSCAFGSSGVDPDGWLVFQKDLTSYLEFNGFRDSVVTGWQLDITSKAPFHGQRVKLFLDDVSISTEKESVVLAGANGAALKSNEGGPHLVGYCSLYDEFPQDAVNWVKNASFEMGLDCWYTGAMLGPGDEAKPGQLDLIEPEVAIQAVDCPDAPNGRKALKFSHPDGRPAYMKIQSMPIKIKEGQPYTFSFYAKASAPCSISTYYSGFNIGTEWKRYSHFISKMPSFKQGSKPYPGRAVLNISHRGAEDVWIDAVELQEGPLTEFENPGYAAVAVRPDNYDGIYLPEEKPGFTVSLFNGANDARKGVVKLSIKDFEHRKIAELSESFDLAPQSGMEFSKKVPPGWRHYKISAQLEAKGQKTQTAATAVSVIDDLSGIKGNDFFGVLGISWPGRPNFKDSLRLNRKLGAGWMTLYNVAEMGRSKTSNWREDPYVFDMIEWHIDNIKAWGFEPYLVTAGIIPSWAKKDSGGVEIIGDKETAEAHDWCKALASHLKGKVRYYGLFNEYMRGNLAPRAANVAKIMPAAYSGYKESDPNCVVVGGNEDSATINRDMIVQLESHFKLGTLKYMDVVAVHPYNYPGGPESTETYLQYGELRQAIKKYNGGVAKPIWGTESGYRAVDVLHYDDYEPESLYYPWYCTELEQAENQTRDNVCALGEGVQRFLTFYTDFDIGFESFTLIERNDGIRPKTSFPAYAFMVKELAGAKPVKRLQKSESSFLGYLFRDRDGKLLAVLWRYPKDKLEKKALIQLPADKLKVFNLVGEEFKSLPGSSLELPLGLSAFYVHQGDANEADFEKAIEGISFDGASISLSMKDASTLTASVKNGGASKCEGRLELSASDGVKIPPASLSLGKGETKSFEFKLPARSASRIVAAKLVCGANSSQTAELRSVFATHAKAGDLSKDGLPSGRSKAPLELGPANLAGDGAKYSDPKDLSAKVSLFWDDDALYVAANVLDDIHSTPAPHDAPWMNDAMQLDFALPQSRSIAELNFCLEKAGPACVLSPGMEQGVDISLVRKSIRREGGSTVYEAAIPWRALGLKGPQSGLKLNLAFCDNDGSAKDGSKNYKQIELAKGLVDAPKESTFSYELFFLP